MGATIVTKAAALREKNCYAGVPLVMMGGGRVAPSSGDSKMRPSRYWLLATKYYLDDFPRRRRERPKSISQSTAPNHELASRIYCCCVLTVLAFCTASDGAIPVAPATKKLWS